MAIFQDPTLRYRIWKILLRVNDLPAETFLEYVARGPCEVREKIRNDTFRCVAIRRIAESPLMLQLVQYISDRSRFQGASPRRYARPSS